MSTCQSSYPPFVAEPSSSVPRLSVVRHAHNLQQGPGLAKGRLVSATSVQLGQEFRCLREAIGMTQPDAAKLFLVTIKTIRNWEYGSEMPATALERMRAMARLRMVSEL